MASRYRRPSHSTVVGDVTGGLEVRFLLIREFPGELVTKTCTSGYCASPVLGGGQRATTGMAIRIVGFGWLPVKGFRRAPVRRP
jgi:hypothetical protein